jgi:K+-sensing histidine kinase KdpD
LGDIHASLIATVSLGLRTPLAVATTGRSTARWIEQFSGWPTNESRALAIVRASLAQISLIEGLLDASRIQHRAGAVDLLRTALASCSELLVGTCR